MIDPHFAAVVTGSVQLVASAASGVLSDLIGRLPLLIVSTSLMSAALAGFGFYARYGAEQDWVPLLCVVLFVCSFSLGMNPISWLLVGEVFPLEFRGAGASAAAAFSYVCAFIAVKTFVDMRSAFGLGGTFWAYAVVSLFGLVFCVLCVPETKGRTLDEMEPAEGGGGGKVKGDGDNMTESSMLEGKERGKV